MRDVIGGAHQAEQRCNHQEDLFATRGLISLLRSPLEHQEFQTSNMDGKPEAPSLQKEQDKDGEAAPSLEKDARAKNETSDTQKQFYVIPTGTTQWFEDASKGKTVVLQVISSFEYPKLPGPEYIRLIHLYPAGNQPSILNASLEVHKLDAQCDYEAISYTWGDYSDPNGTIVLNGQVLKTTLNLYAALIAYSYTDRVRVLWADAVCINQMDAAEKAQQVSIMSDIYSMAKTVQVWLEYKAGSAPHRRDNPEFFFSLANCLQAIPCRPNPFVPELDILPAARLDDTAERAINPTTEPPWMILVKTLTAVSVTTAVLKTFSHGIRRSKVSVTSKLVAWHG
jgi:hypothetical protein